MFIYKIVCAATGDCYIGQTIQKVETRYRRHLREAIRGSQTHLHRAIRLYGADVFSIEIIETVTDRCLNERERWWISEVKPSYNMTKGGDGGDTSKSEGYQQALLKRDLFGSNNPMWGKRGSDNPQYGRTRSIEQKERMRAGIQSAWDTQHDRREAARRRISGFENNPGALKSAKRVEFDGIVYKSVSEAVRLTGRARATILKRGIFR